MTEGPDRGLLIPPTNGTPDGFGPLTQDEKEQFEYLRTVMLHNAGGLDVVPMRVMHAGVPRVALCVVGLTGGDEMVVTPLALLLDGALFEQMKAPEGGVPVPATVMKDVDDAPDPDRPDEVCPNGCRRYGEWWAAEDCPTHLLV